ncbi:hypothetical protein DF044_10465 [Burkholderia contaminans]|nr:hypothetical protein DF044_10465 [Burkholderia contaminans]
MAVRAAFMVAALKRVRLAAARAARPQAARDACIGGQCRTRPPFELWRGRARAVGYGAASPWPAADASRARLSRTAAAS